MPSPASAVSPSWQGASIRKKKKKKKRNECHDVVAWLLFLNIPRSALAVVIHRIRLHPFACSSHSLLEFTSVRNIRHVNATRMYLRLFCACFRDIIISHVLTEFQIRRGFVYLDSISISIISILRLTPFAPVLFSLENGRAWFCSTLNHLLFTDTHIHTYTYSFHYRRYKQKYSK